MENSVHEPLKRLCRISETERHSHKLKQAKRSCYSSFGNIFGGDWELVGTHKIQFGEMVAWMWGTGQRSGTVVWAR